MVDSIYLDGCSYVYGLNLNTEYNLESLFKNDGGYRMQNQSRPGKSNLAIAMDVFKYSESHDIIVVGWTHATRFYLEVQGQDIDFLPNRFNLDLKKLGDEELIEHAYHQFHRYFYSMYQTPFIDNFSDMLISTVYEWLRSRGKRVVFFSFEPRKVDFDLYVPYTPPEFRLPCMHLNQKGTRYLFDLLQRKISEQ